MQITRESIFVSTIRSFCTGFAVFLGILLAVVIGFIVIGFFNGPDLLPQKANVSIAQDANGDRQMLAPTAPAILRIDLHGVIGDTYLRATDIENILLDSREDLLGHNRVKGVLLHLNTPGGDASDSAAIHRLILEYKAKYKVPVYAYVQDLCASGGMYIASACDKIFAAPWSLVGSVGVILSPHFNFSQAMDKWGIQAITLTEGKDKDTFNPYRPWKPDEASSFVPVMAALYDQFIDAVTQGRPRITKQQLIDTYGAQVFVAQTAMDYGYIDSATANYSDAVNALASAAGIREGEHYQVLLLSPPHNLLSDLLKPTNTLFQGKITHRFQIHPSLPDELCGKPLYLYLAPQ